MAKRKSIVICFDENRPAEVSDVIESYSASGEPIGVSLPVGSRFLGVHAPVCSPGLLFYLALQSNGYLSAYKYPSKDSEMPSGNESTTVNIAFLPQNLGELKQALPFGRVVTLICERGMAWLIYNPDNENYTLQESLPEAPELELTVSPVNVPGYTLIAGNRPSISMSVELSKPDEISEASVANWLAGIAGALSEDMLSKVYSAIGVEICRYVEAVGRAGYFLGPVRGIAAFGEAIPSRAVISSADITPTFAFVDSATLHAGYLNLRLSLTFQPMAISAKMKISERQRAWSPVFETVDIYISSEAARFASVGDMTPYAISHVTDVDGKSYPCLIFHAEDADSITRSVQSKRDFRKVFSARIKGVTSISAIPEKSADESGIFYPDYGDMQKLHPTGGIVTDDGVILYGGTGEFSDESGNFQQISLSNAVMAPVPDNGVVYRDITRVGELPVMGVAPAGKQRSASGNSRHPIHTFSADAVRLLTSDTSGLYRNVKIVGNVGIAAPGLCVALDSGTAFVSGRGVSFLSVSSKISDLFSPLGIGEPTGMFYDNESHSLILQYPYLTAILSIAGGKLYVQDNLRLADAIGFSGNILFNSATRRLQRLKIERSNSVISAGDVTSPDSSETSGGIYLRSGVLTLDDAFKRKRVFSVESNVAGEIILEGSDSLSHWHRLAAGDAPLRALHIPAFRYFRLTLVLSETSSYAVPTLQLTYMEK